MAPDNPRVLIAIDLLQDFLDLSKNNFVMRAKVGTFAKLFYFFIQ